MPAWITLWTTDKLIDLWISFVSISDMKNLRRVSKDCSFSNIGLRKYVETLEEKNNWKNITPVNRPKTTIRAYHQWIQNSYQLIKPIRECLSIVRSRIWKQMNIYVQNICLIHRSSKLKWFEFNQWIAHSYPTTQYVKCTACSIFVPIEEIHDTDLCIFCYDYSEEVWYKSLMYPVYLDTPGCNVAGLTLVPNVPVTNADARPQPMAYEDP